jgi:hypothetical protein
VLGLPTRDRASQFQRCWPSAVTAGVGICCWRCHRCRRSCTAFARACAATAGSLSCVGARNKGRAGPERGVWFASAGDGGQPGLTDTAPACERGYCVDGGILTPAPPLVVQLTGNCAARSIPKCCWAYHDSATAASEGTLRAPSPSRWRALDRCLAVQSPINQLQAPFCREKWLQPSVARCDQPAHISARCHVILAKS